MQLPRLVRPPHEIGSVDANVLMTLPSVFDQKRLRTDWVNGEISFPSEMKAMLNAITTSISREIEVKAAKNGFVSFLLLLASRPSFKRFGMNGLYRNIKKDKRRLFNAADLFNAFIYIREFSIY